MDLNIYLKLLSGALELKRSDIAEIVTLGGVEVSGSRVDGWLRGKDSTKNATGNSDLAGSRIRRSREITPEEFHAFCVGLKPWLENIEKKRKFFLFPAPAGMNQWQQRIIPFPAPAGINR